MKTSPMPYVNAYQDTSIVILYKLPTMTSLWLFNEISHLNYARIHKDVKRLQETKWPTFGSF